MLFNVALRPQRPYGLLGTGIPGLPARLAQLPSFEIEGHIDGRHMDDTGLRGVWRQLITKITIYKKIVTTSVIITVHHNLGNNNSSSQPR